MAMTFDKNAQHYITLPNGQYLGRNVPEATITAWARINTPEFTSIDIGTTKKGTFVLNGTDSYMVRGSGTDIWNTADGFRFTYIQVSGDATFTARITYLQNVHAHAKLGVMFRESLNTNSVFFHSAAKPTASANTMFDYRSSTGASATNFSGPVSPLPDNECWVRIQRVGNTFTAWTSLDGVTFTQIGSGVTPGATMPNTMYVGLACTSHIDGTLVEGRFDNVALNPPTSGAERWIIQVTNGTTNNLTRIAISLFTNGRWRATGRRTDAEGSNNLDSTFLAEANRTYFLAARYGFSTGRLDLFIDAELNNTLSVPGWTGHSDDTEPMAACIAARGTAATGFFDGTIDDLRIYHHLLSANDIRSLYIAQGRDRLVGYVRYPLREAGSNVSALAQIQDVWAARSHGATATNIDTYPVYSPSNIVAGGPRGCL